MDFYLEEGGKRKMTNNERAKEFLKCLGNGKTIYQIESEEENE